MNWTWRERPALAVTLGSASVLIAASVLGMLLAFAEKVPCRAGAWNYNTKQFQDACYTDIYPLYYTEGLSAGKVPYTGHPVEYPVLIGGAMQAVAWLVRNIDAAIRGREIFDFTVILLAVCAVAAVLATARATGRDARWQGLMVALSPALILNAFVSWDLIAMALTALGLAAWAARRGVWAGALLGLGVATKFYPLVVLGALLLLCLRAGGLRDFVKTLAAAVVAWLAVNLPVMIAAPSGWATFYVFSKNRGADWGSVWYMFEYFNLPKLGDSQLSVLNEMSAAALIVAFAAIVLLVLAAPAPAAAGVLSAAGRVPDDQQGLVPAVRHLAGAAGRARPAPAVAVRPVAVRRDRLFLRHLGLPDLRHRAAPGHRLSGHQHRLVLHPAGGQVPHRRPARRLRGAGHSFSRTGRGACARPRRPAGGVLDQAPDRFRIRLARPVSRAGAVSAS